ncbi:hypothetical protein AVEN_3676-1 [Araneus ventricosus]|uniref:Uncharacterized protein n=1 Tax=Araneus ventricosus TaxID=182803 RepID=A0A4Y2R9Q5_ARAVE|nr:hypothetical protein AVEN_3676-1 [Araneus ventricosus]
MKEVALPLTDDCKCEEMLRKTRFGRFYKFHEDFCVQTKNMAWFLARISSTDGGVVAFPEETSSRAALHEAAITAWAVSSDGKAM